MPTKCELVLQKLVREEVKLRSELLQVQKKIRITEDLRNAKKRRALIGKCFRRQIGSDGKFLRYYFVTEAKPGYIPVGVCITMFSRTIHSIEPLTSVHLDREDNDKITRISRKRFNNILKKALYKLASTVEREIV